MIAVIQAYDWWESGQCAEWWGDDPEWWLVDATRYYHRAIGTARAAVEKLRKPPSNTPRPPLGHVVSTVRG